ALTNLARVQDHVIGPHIRPSDRAKLAGSHPSPDREQHCSSSGLGHSAAWPFPRVPRGLEQNTHFPPLDGPLSVRHIPRLADIPHRVHSAPAPLPAGVL